MAMPNRQPQDANAQPLPAFIVGLGGSGAWTVIHVKSQLLSMYGSNHLPGRIGLLVADTAADPLANLGTQGLTMADGAGVGKLELAPHEYAALGGDAERMLKRVENGDLPHIEHWLEANWFLRNLSNYNLDAGAGMFRQLGRLSLFQDVAAPNQSKLYRGISSKITTIQQHAGAARTLSVIIVGSWVGGTGSGTFVDVAHLIQRIAHENRLKVLIRGYFYLPEAFRTTLQPADLAKSQTRAFAAMREFNRFFLNQDWEVGYPMSYLGQGGQGNANIWRSTSKGKLYDMVYLIDGTRSNQNSLNQLRIDKGPVVSVADAILCQIDSNFGEVSRQQIANVRKDLAERRQEGIPYAYVGSTGTYSIQMPIKQIIEAWSFKLAQDVLIEFLGADEFDASTNTTASLSATHGKDQTEISDEVKHLLQSSATILDPIDAKRQVVPTLMWAEIYRIYRNIMNNGAQSVVNQLGGNNLDNWEQMLIPGETERDPRARAVVDQTKAIREEKPSTTVITSDKVKPRRQPSDEVEPERIRSEITQLLDRQLGQRDAKNGLRSGGRYQTTMNRFTVYQLERFRLGLQAYISAQLNGQDPAGRPITARAGKLGWTAAVLDELYDTFSAVLEVMRDVRKRRAANNKLRDSQEMMQAEAQKEMIAQMNGRAFPGMPHPGIKAQQAFIEQSDHTLELYRTEQVLEEVYLSIEGMRNYVETARKQVRDWVQVLALRHDSLLSQVSQGINHVRAERDKAAELPSRMNIDDKDWEKDKYERYVEKTNAKEALFRALTWTVKEDKDDYGKDAVIIDLDVRIPSSTANSLRNTQRGKWQHDNVQAVMQFCRTTFEEARKTESVVSYLMDYKYQDANVLAGIIYDQSGLLLSYDNSIGGGGVPSIYMLAYEDSSRADQNDYLNTLMNGLRQLADIPLGDQGDPYASRQNSDDRFRLTVLNIAELIPLEALHTYEEYSQEYLKDSNRYLQHLFPAEVKASHYESLLKDVLRQQVRMFVPGVVILLEQMELFRLFLYCVAHGIIFLDTDIENTLEVEWVWYINLPSSRPGADEDEFDTLWLTYPSTTPSLLDAAHAFVYHQEDRGYRKHQPDFEFKLNMDHVRSYLEAVREAYIAERLAVPDTLAANDTTMRGWLDAMAGDSEIWEYMAYNTARYDILDAYVRGLQEGLNDPGITLELYDLYSASILVLKEQMSLIRKDVSRYAPNSGSKPTKNGGDTKSTNPPNSPSQRRSK